jgi:formyltetrahydrofolate deformylase
MIRHKIPVKNNKNTAILLVHCDDKKGINAEITDFVYKNNGNVIHLDQHVDRQEKVFFMRIEWELEGFLIPREKIGDFFGTQVAQKFDMSWNLYFSDYTPKMALFVSKLSHCLFDILSRYQSGEWNVDIPLIISNHEDLSYVAEHFKIPFFLFPVNKENKLEQEKKEIELLKEYEVDFVVLARYMQILTQQIIDVYPNRIINIHHSFLPAFPGAKPYHSAYSRGVKIIGATSHYVTEDLDSGPIIEQDVTHITHKDAVSELVRKGQDLEKIVLSTAIYQHLQRNILVYNNRTVVFS